jgi:hypothetical protein
MKEYAMNHVCRWMTLLVVLSMLFVLGCGDFGLVNQGRVIDYDREKGIVTYIRDTNYQEPGRPVYELLPPVSVRIPVDPKEMGPEPLPGKRMKLDVEKRQIVIFNIQTQDFQVVNYTLIDQQENVFRDDSRVVGVSFPVVDREKKTITVYSSRQNVLMAFSVPDEFFALPDTTWRAGDEIRYYYKDPDQALRMMNVTRTDIFGH